jgi:hypothetical protein
VTGRGAPRARALLVILAAALAAPAPAAAGLVPRGGSGLDVLDGQPDRERVG